MKLFTIIIIFFVFFFKKENILSKNNLFNVNNILLEKNDNDSSKQLANKAINEAFNVLIKKILLKDDISKVSNLNSKEIRDLVTYYKISKNTEQNKDKVNFSVTFDKNKIHNLFFKRSIFYSDISDKEFYILPIFINKDEINIFSSNFFYENWNSINNDELLEFILPLENIEIIQNINQGKDNLLQLDLSLLFSEYVNKNIALVLIEYIDKDSSKIYLKTKIEGKIISKNLKLKKNNLNQIKLNEKIIFEVKEEIINLVKSQNLIDVRTPSFLNVKLNLDKKSSLFLLKSRIQNIDIIENIFVQEFNKDYIYLKIKYLGKLEKIINQLRNENISLKLIRDEWLIETL